MIITMEQKALDFLMRDLVGVEKKASTFVVYMYLYARNPEGKESVRASLRDLSSGTGLSKRAVQHALKHLRERALLEVQREGPTTVPEYRTLRPWEIQRLVGRNGDAARMKFMVAPALSGRRSKLRA